MKRWTNLIFLAGAFAWSTGACASGNLVANSTFDAGITGWTPSTEGTGAVSWSSSFGNPPGSGFASSPGPNSAASFNQCMAIDAPEAVDFMVDARVVNSSGSGGYVFAAFMYSSTNCSTGLLGNLPAGSESFPPNAWAGFRSSVIGFSLLPGTQSVLILVGTRTFADAGSFQSYDVDNIYFGSDSFFANGFDP